MRERRRYPGLRIRDPDGCLELREPCPLDRAQIVAIRTIRAALQIGDIGIEFGHNPSLSMTPVELSDEVGVSCAVQGARYLFSANRSYVTGVIRGELRQRAIKAVMPEKRDQAAVRARQIRRHILTQQSIGPCAYGGLNCSLNVSWGRARVAPKQYTDVVDVTYIHTQESDVVKKLLSLGAGVLMLGALMAGGPAVADESVALPDSAELVQINGADVVVASRDLSAEELTQVGEAQSAESIENAVEILMNGEEPDGLHGQVVFDFDGPGEYSAAVLVNSSDVVTFGTSPAGTQCKTGTRAGVSTHLIQTKQTYFAYCGNGTWTGSRAQMTKFRTYPGTTARVGTSSTSWQLCPRNTECAAPTPFTLKYVAYTS